VWISWFCAIKPFHEPSLFYFQPLDNTPFHLHHVTSTHLITCMHCICRNPTLAKCEDEIHTPKVGDLESSGTPECLEFDNNGQNTLPWGVLDVVGKLSKRATSLVQTSSRSEVGARSYDVPKSRESKTETISGLHFGSPGKKCHSGASAAEWHREYYREDGGDTSRARGVVCHESSS
jgi:hypothetical protein